MKTNKRGDLFLTFDFSADAPSIEQQAKDQGVELLHRPKIYDELAWAISVLWAYGIITPLQQRDMTVKLNDLIIRDLRRKIPLKPKEERARRKLIRERIYGKEKRE